MRLAGVVLHALEHGLDGRREESKRVRQIRLVVDAATCSQSEWVRALLMEVAERATSVQIQTPDGADPGADLGRLADELVDLVDDGVEGEEDADEVRRLVADLKAACGWKKA